MNTYMGKLPKDKRPPRKLSKPDQELARKVYHKEQVTMRNVQDALRVGGLSRKETSYILCSMMKSLNVKSDA